MNTAVFGREGREPFHFSALLLLVKHLGLLALYSFCGYNFQTSNFLPLGPVSTDAFVSEGFHDS